MFVQLVSNTKQFLFQFYQSVKKVLWRKVIECWFISQHCIFHFQMADLVHFLLHAYEKSLIVIKTYIFCSVYVSRHEKYKISETVHHFFKHSLVNLRVRGEGDGNEIIFIKSFLSPYLFFIFRYNCAILRFSVIGN